VSSKEIKSAFHHRMAYPKSPVTAKYSLSRNDLSLTSCTFVKLQLWEQGTNLYGHNGHFGGRCGVNLNILNQWLYYGIDDTHSHSVGQPSM